MCEEGKGGEERERERGGGGGGGESDCRIASLATMNLVLLV